MANDNTDARNVQCPENSVNDSSAKPAPDGAEDMLTAEKAKSSFLAHISHEIRTPLNAIIGLSEVLAEEPLTEEQQGHLRIIRESAQNMLALINDILDYSKIESGHFSLDISEYSLEHLLAILESATRPQAIHKGLEFEICQRTDLPVNIKTDPMRLRQCLANLINNAIDFTEKGYVRLSVSLEKDEGVDCIRFDVEDTGVGIGENDRDRIFEEFTQAAGARSRSSAGTGLGLTITQRIVKLLGGKISLESKLGEGSTFSIVVPAGLDAKQQSVFNRNEQISRIRNEKTVDEDLRLSGTVLVAEDTPTNQTLIRLLLTKLGLGCVIAEDGKQAVEQALSGDFDLVLMDIQMPHMNGYDATRKLREAGFTKPVIAVTAHAMRGDKEKCLAAGCDDYISKPINRKQLVDVLRTYLKPKSDGIARQVDAAAEEVRQLSSMCDEAAGDGTGEQDIADSDDSNQPSTQAMSADARSLIDFKAVTEICDDPEVIKEVAQMFLKDSPRCIKSIAEAIKSANPKHIRMYAHSLKGAALQIGAKRLADVALQLECAGRDKNMLDVPVLFSTVQDEYSRLTLLLSQPNWIDIAKSSGH
jgi:CheY-like chemotaxis protein/HPt (histidine-containing phosphotransfer) domain-containing protein/two-component sensor histidine kinase